MKKKLFVKIISLIMVFCFAFSTMPYNSLVASAAGSKVNISDKAELEKKLAEIDKKLSQLGAQSKETQEYLSVLDEKISYLNQQYSIAKADVSKIEKKVSTLETQIANNEKEIENSKLEIADLEQEIKTLNYEFQGVYDDYTARLRAMYISGTSSSILTLLFSSNGVSQLLTRIEMISAITNHDVELMKSFKEKTDIVVDKSNDLKAKNQKLSSDQVNLTNSKKSLTTDKAELLQKEEELEGQRANIEAQQKEANALLKKLNDESNHYSEFREMTQEEIDAIDRAIEEADKIYATTTTTTTKPTTTKPTTTKPTTKPAGTTKPTTTTTTTTAKPSSNTISLTYPCPAYTTITCGYWGYYNHTGCDFSTGRDENCKIVAAESGTVIVSTDITCNRSTCTKQYHGGGYCSYGRYIVIHHDKKTASGQEVYTLYAHNNSRVVASGQHVEKGQLIAYSGSTGNSTGPHCHFEVRVGGSKQANAVNPANYLP